jgi:hypothetical protein
VYVVARRVKGDPVDATVRSDALEALLVKVQYECLRQLTNSLTENESKVKLQGTWKRLLHRQVHYDDATEWVQKLYQVDARTLESGLEVLSAVPFSHLRNILPELAHYLPHDHTRHWLPGPIETGSGLFVLAPCSSVEGVPPNYALVIHLDPTGMREAICRCQARILPSGTVVDLPPFEVAAAELKLLEYYIHAMFQGMWMKL